MSDLTPRQRQILQFIERCLNVVDELEPLAAKEPYALSLLACYRGIAQRLRTDASDTRTALR